MYSFVIFCVSLKLIIISFTVPFFLQKSAYINFSTVVHILSHKIRIVYDITVPFSDLISLNISLMNPPVLAYPNFDLDFVLETDVSHQGLGAVLLQRQADG